MWYQVAENTKCNFIMILKIAFKEKIYVNIKKFAKLIERYFWIDSH